MRRYYTTTFDGRTFEHADGPFVLYAEHEARVKELEGLLRRVADAALHSESGLMKLVNITLAPEAMPADYTIDGDGVWMGGKWHPKGAPK